MAFDVGVISGYLMVLFERGARHLADRTLDALLDRLANLIQQRIDRRTLTALRRNPRDIEANERASHEIATLAQRDRAFASELQALIRDLDRHGGRTVIENVTAGTIVQASYHGIAAGRDAISVNAPDPDDWSAAPGWVKATFALGAVICAIGLVISFINLPSSPGSFPVGLVVFVIGFVILLVGALGRMMSRRK